MRALGMTLGCFWLASCGYVGDPLPPALKIPNPVADLSVAQVGPYLELRFTPPLKTMEDLDLEKIGALEVRISETWPEGGQTVAVDPTAKEAKIPVRDWAGKEVAIGVRVANAKLRYSPWSNLVRLKVENAVARPTAVKAEAAATGVNVTWEAEEQAGVTWRVYRLSSVNGVLDKERVALGTAPARNFLDTGTVYGGTYRYFVEGILGSALSELSESAEIVPIDKFAPAAPQGLAALSGATAVQLSWERGTEPDLSHYRVYRAGGDGPLALLADKQSSATYSDATARGGQRFRYAVSAVDRNGNESSKSQEVEIIAP
jgi:hypothetical protein